MEKEDFISQYQTKWWYETSKRIKARDNNTCQLCGRNDKPLSVHHLIYDNGKISVDDRFLITLCEDCHKIQNDSKESCRDIIAQLKEILTDYELEHILEGILLKYYSFEFFPIYMSSIPYLQAEDDSVQIGFDNLYKWRRKALTPYLKNVAIEQYLKEWENDPDIKKEIEIYFSREFGEQIQEHIDKINNNCHEKR